MGPWESASLLPRTPGFGRTTAASTAAPVFVVGTQRSGTTLLCQILNAHPRLYVLNEFWELYRHVSGQVRDPADLRQVLVRHLVLPADHGLFAGPRTAEAAEAADTYDPFAEFEAAIAFKLGLVGKTRWGIKDPRLTYFLPLFAERYPLARFIVITRDPRGVCASQLRQRWNVANVYSGARLWLLEVQLHRAFQKAFPDRVHWIRYRDLIGAPEASLESICRFLGESFSDEMLHHHEKSPIFSIHEGNRRATNPIDPSAVEEWRRRLSPRAVSIIESVAGPLMDELGYERMGRRVHFFPLERALYQTHQWLATTYRWQRRSGWSGIRGRLTRWLALHAWPVGLPELIADL